MNRLLLFLLLLLIAAGVWPSSFQSSNILTGTTASIGGGAVNQGDCTSGTATVTGVSTAMAIAATPATYPGDPFVWSGYRSAANTVTVKVCYLGVDPFSTPTASAYNVRAIP